MDSFFVLDSFVENLVDPVGAGDALIAYATACLAVTKNEAIVSIISQIAAAIACEKEGNVPIKLSEIEDKLEKIQNKIENI